MNDKREQRMIAAHKAGREAFLTMSLSQAYDHALLHYYDREDGDSFLAGWKGEARRALVNTYKSAETARSIHKQAAAFEPLRPLRAPDNGTPYYVSAPLHYVEHPRVDYGEPSWPSRSYWLVPLQA